LKEAESTGWIRTEGPNGKKKKRVPYIPDPSDRSYGSEDDPDEATRQTGLTGGSDPSDGTRQTHQTRPEQDHNRARTTGGAPPPGPRRTESPQAAPRADLGQEPASSKTPDAEVDQESPVPSGARRCATHPLFAAGRGPDGKPLCTFCRRGELQEAS
jgi:hypothetical protein